MQDLEARSPDFRWECDVGAPVDADGEEGARGQLVRPEITGGNALPVETLRAEPANRVALAVVGIAEVERALELVETDEIADVERRQSAMQLGERLQELRVGVNWP